MQYRTSNSLCRKCHRPLDIEEPVTSCPTAGDQPARAGSTEAGLQVAGQVREIRRARHLSQRQLAGRMQVPRTYISKIENGKAIPTLGSLERLANALEVDVCQLVRDSRSRREEEVAAILGDPFLAEIAALLPHLDSLHRTLVYGARARRGDGPPPHRLKPLGLTASLPSGALQLSCAAVPCITSVLRRRSSVCGASALVLGSKVPLLIPAAGVYAGFVRHAGRQLRPDWACRLPGPLNRCS